MTLVTRKSYKCCRPVYVSAPAGYDYATTKNMKENFSGCSVFCKARILGLNDDADDSTDDDECTHQPPVTKKLATQRVLMVNQKSTRLRAPFPPIQEVEGDSEIETMAAQVLRKSKRVRFKPKDDLVTLNCYDLPKGEAPVVGKDGIFPATGRNGVYEIIVEQRKVYQGKRTIHKDKKERAPAQSSTGDNEGANGEAPSLNPASDASVPDKPFVRSDVLSHYLNACEDGSQKYRGRTFTFSTTSAPSHALIFYEGILNKLRMLVTHTSTSMMTRWKEGLSDHLLL